MATFYSQTSINEQPYEIIVGITGRKISNVQLLSQQSAKIRPFMYLDLLSLIMNDWLYVAEDTTVKFGYTKSEHYTSQPCLVVQNSKYGEKKYLLNNIVTESWLKTVYSNNINAMIHWWRKNRGKYFKKPFQQWTYKRLD